MAQTEMQTALSRICIYLTESIFFEDDFNIIYAFYIPFI